MKTAFLFPSVYLLIQQFITLFLLINFQLLVRKFFLFQVVKFALFGFLRVLIMLSFCFRLVLGFAYLFLLRVEKALIFQLVATLYPGLLSYFDLLAQNYSALWLNIHLKAFKLAVELALFHLFMLS